jgi:hypothetical protein
VAGIQHIVGQFLEIDSGLFDIWKQHYYTTPAIVSARPNPHPAIRIKYSRICSDCAKRLGIKHSGIAEREKRTDSDIPVFSTLDLLWFVAALAAAGCLKNKKGRIGRTEPAL